MSTAYIAGGDTVTERDAKRFWAKVDKSGECWLWTGATGPKGYGKFSVGPSHDRNGRRRNSMVSAHRFAWELANGPIPEGKGFHGTCVLHRCDTPRCVRDAHLFLGTNADNVRDMDNKGRRVSVNPVGEQHPLHKLTAGQAGEIRRRLADFERGMVPALAVEFGVKPSTIWAIKHGRLWAHLNAEAS